MLTRFQAHSLSILLDKVMQTSESIQKHAQKKCFIRRKFVSSLQEALDAIQCKPLLCKRIDDGLKKADVSLDSI